MKLRYRPLQFFSVCVLLLVSYCSAYAAVSWFPFGPDGGSARVFATDPHDDQHVYLGAANGWLYDSHDGGRHWKRLARVGQRDDLVIDSIEVNAATPNRMLVGAWVVDHPDGGIYVSTDGGTTWTESKDMKGRSIRALASAPSNPSVVVAGALDGVYRSTDAGNHWSLISPEGSKEIHEIESLAIDPRDPQVIYAGTWHLPWKTTDGGSHWNNIKEGIIEDSDVFSIIVDPRTPTTVYASACSGIYKSENAGARFAKVQGIPSTARRTRVLMQDPQHSDIVFAGTTEGLFRSADAGKTWIRNTAPDVIVNDVYVDPKHTDHVLLATDFGGVLMSDDGGFTFRSSNSGFSARQIVAYAANATKPAEIAVGVVNDKRWGGVFMSKDGGLTWDQKSDGLDGRDVFSLLQTNNDTLLAGTNHGIFRWDGQRWNLSALLMTSSTAVRRNPATRARGAARPAVPGSSSFFEGSVYSLASQGSTVYATTGDAVLVSLTAGDGWQTIPSLGHLGWRYVAIQDRHVVVGGLHDIALSNDSGHTWKTIHAPEGIGMYTAVTLDSHGRIWVGGLEGLSYSDNDGLNWQKVPNLYVSDVSNVYFDGHNQRVLITVNHPTMAYGIDLSTLKISYFNTGWNLRFMREVGDHLLGVTLFDGIVLQPRMVNSSAGQ